MLKFYPITGVEQKEILSLASDHRSTGVNPVVARILMLNPQGEDVLSKAIGIGGGERGKGEDRQVSLLSVCLEGGMLGTVRIED
jgi:hypothetical protein